MYKYVLLIDMKTKKNINFSKPLSLKNPDYFKMN